RLRGRQSQTANQQHLPIDQPYPGRAQPEDRGENPAHCHNQQKLQAIRSQVMKDDSGVHFALRIARTSSSKSFCESLRSSTKCINRGSAEPLNTRSTNSRTKPRSTWLFGCEG